MSEADTVTRWQHLSPWAVLLLGVRGVAAFVRENFPLVIGAGAGATFIEAIGLREVVLGAVVLAVAIGLLSLQYYRRFRFCLEDEVLRVQRGLFEQRELKVAAARVQNTRIEQPFYMRPFGVVRFSVDTPGGATAEVDLPGISRAAAVVLAEALGAARGRGAAEAETTDAAPAPPPARTLYRIDVRGLVLHGLSSNYAYLLAVALTPLLQPLERAARRRLGPWDEVEWLRWAGEHPALFAVAVMTVLVLSLVLASVAAAGFRFWGYRLLREDGRYVQSSGLLNRQEQALSAAKLQSVEWVQTALGRILGRGHLICRQYGGMREAEQLGQGFVVPGLDRAMATRLGAEFWPGLTVGAWRPVHRAYRRVQALRIGAVMAVALVLLALANADARWLTGLLLVPVLAWPLAHLRWRAVAWQRGSRYTLVRRGLLGRRTTLFPLDHVQSVTLRQSWLQRRRRLVTLELVLASGSVTIPYIAAGDARYLADEALYRVECGALLPAV